MFELVAADTKVMQVVPYSDGSLSIGGKGPYLPLGNDAYGLPRTDEPAAGPRLEFSDIVAFAVDSRGDTLLLPSSGNAAYARVTSIDNPVYLASALRFAFLLALSGVLAVSWRSRTRVERAALAAVVALAITALAALAVLYIGFDDAENWRLYMLAGDLPRIIALTVLSNVSVILVALIVILVPPIWARRAWGSGWPGMLRRLHYTVIAVGGSAALWVLAFSNLIGWRLPLQESAHCQAPPGIAQIQRFEPTHTRVAHEW
jgi:hypothetical protein